MALREVELRDWWRVALRELPSGLILGSILGAIGTMAVLSTVLAFIAFLRGLAVIGPVRTAIVSTIEPFWTALLGGLVLSQALGPRTLLGGVCIAAAVVLLQLGHGRAATPEPV
jgi:drug/metabolite transporter (DMT)-like permease